MDPFFLLSSPPGWQTREIARLEGRTSALQRERLTIANDTEKRERCLREKSAVEERNAALAEEARALDRDTQPLAKVGVVGVVVVVVVVP